MATECHINITNSLVIKFKIHFLFDICLKACQQSNMTFLLICHFNASYKGRYLYVFMCALAYTLPLVVVVAMMSVAGRLWSPRSFQLHNRWWIKTLFGFRFFIRGWCSGNFCCLIIFNNYLVINCVSMKCTLTHAKFPEDAHAATVQAVNKHMDHKHTKYTRQTNNYCLSGFSPIEQPINWYWLRPVS